jgi:hypothetical protein
MNAENELLASAYLDDVLSDEERARAEADPEVMAAVERMAELRQELLAVERPNAARRDAAINAALDVFSAERPAAAPPPVTSLADRRWTRWLMPAAAAALVAIVAGGIVATSGNQGDDDDAGGDAAVLEEAAGTTEFLTSGEVLTDSAADTAAGPEARDEGAAATTAAGGAEEAATATTAVSSESSLYDVTSGEISSLLVITSPQELTALATDATARFGNPTCDAGTWLGRARLRTGGREVVVDVFLAERGRRVRALNPKSCEVLLSAPAPPP